MEIARRRAEEDPSVSRTLLTGILHGVSGSGHLLGVMMMELAVAFVAPVAFGAAGPALLPFAVHGKVLLSALLAARVVSPLGLGLKETCDKIIDESGARGGEEARQVVNMVPSMVQGTLWGNLILGPTARDVHNPEHINQTSEEITGYILRKCKELVPEFDASQVIHAFAGARAKSDRNDWSAPIPFIYRTTHQNLTPPDMSAGRQDH